MAQVQRPTAVQLVNEKNLVQEEQQTKSSVLPPNPPVSYFTPKCQPRCEEVTKQVDGWFLEHWPFPDQRAREKFVEAGFSRVTCLYFPESYDDRIHFGCELLTILFLIDDLLEFMSFEEGSDYNENLIKIIRKEKSPDNSIPAEWMMNDLWERMRACDHALADEIQNPVFVFMRAQTDQTRVGLKTLGHYLKYRERDVGKALLSALMRFCMGVSLTKQEMDNLEDIDHNCSKHLSVINDIYSWEKEVEVTKHGHEEGAALCSSVQVLADEGNFNVPASKRVLFDMCREWELVHIQLEKKRTDPDGEFADVRGEVLKYIKGMEYQMSGNELWSKTTLRYSVVD